MRSRQSSVGFEKAPISNPLCIFHTGDTTLTQPPEMSAVIVVPPVNTHHVCIQRELVGSPRPGGGKGRVGRRKVGGAGGDGQAGPGGAIGSLRSA